MSPTVYWDAPLWQVVVALVAAGLALGWLARRALRRPSVPAALAALDPALDGQALFYFDGVQGVTGLSAAAEALLAGGSAADDRDRLLVATLLRAFETGRTASQPGWPGAGQHLLALPVGGASGRVAGVVAIVVTEELAPAHEAPPAEAAASGAGSWLALGEDLRLARSRPLVQVRTAGPPAQWATHTLTHTEDAVLRQLLAYRGEVRPAERLFAAAWPDEAVGRLGLRPDQRDRLRRLIFQLRQHVELEPGNPRYVGTAHGVGYILYADEVAAHEGPKP
jgi:hypothetical protein